MTEKLKQQVDKAKAEVAADSKHALSFATRKDLLIEMGPLLKDARGWPTVKGPGLLRRARLAIAAARRVLFAWEKHYPAKHPHQVLELAEGYLAGKVERKALQTKANGFRGGLDTSDRPETNEALFAGRAAVCAGFVALWDELLEPDPANGFSAEELMDPDDPDHFDAAFWAAGAAAGGFPTADDDAFDANRYREFWSWYLDVAVSQAHATVAEPYP